MKISSLERQKLNTGISYLTTFIPHSCTPILQWNTGLSGGSKDRAAGRDSPVTRPVAITSPKLTPLLICLALSRPFDAPHSGRTKRFYIPRVASSLAPVEICKCTSEAESCFDSLGRAAFAKFPYPPLYLKNNTYLQQLDNRNPSNSYFWDIPRGALWTLIIIHHSEWSRERASKAPPIARGIILGRVRELCECGYKNLGGLKIK